MEAPTVCRTCGAPLSATRFGGVCGVCLLASFDESTGAGLTVAAATPDRWSLPGYESLAELARGGTSIVYRAQQTEPAREVAIKVLLPTWSDARGLRERFRLEVQTLARLDHPGILPVFEFGQRDGLPWFSMRLATGGTLTTRLTTYRGRWREIASLMAAVAEAVAHAHEHGVLHRDLKPGNLLFGEDGRVFVADFGLARVLTTQSDVTVTAAVLGTPAYLAPEVIERGAAQATTAGDIWGLGAVLYELLAQAKPFPGGSVPEIVRQIAGEEPAPLPKAPRGLDAIARCALRKNPAKRYRSAQALADDLHAWLQGEALAARPFTLVERLAHGVRRHPVVALLVLGGITAAVAAVGAGVHEAGLRRAEAAARQRAEQAEQATAGQLRSALLAQAQAVRRTGELGQRTKALTALARAAAIMPGLDLRDEALAALVRADLVEEARWPARRAGYERTVFDPRHQRYAVENEHGGFALRPQGGAAGTPALANFAAPNDQLSAGLPVFSSDGRWFAVRDRDEIVRLYATGDGRLVLSLPGRPYPMPVDYANHGKDLAFSPDGSLFACSAPRGGFTVHRLPDGAQVAAWAGEAEPAAGSPAGSPLPPLTSVVFSPDGRQIVAVSLHEHPRRVYRFALTAPVGSMSVALSIASSWEPPAAAYCLAWSPDARELAVGGNGQVHFVNPIDGHPRLSLPGFEGNVLYLFWNDDGTRLLTWSETRRAVWWDATSGRPLVSLTDFQEIAPAFDPATNHFAKLSQVNDGVVWKLSEASIVRLFASPLPDGSAANFGQSLAWSADGRWLAVAEMDGVSVRDGRTGALLAKREEPMVNDQQSVAWAGPAALWVAGASQGLRWLPLKEAAPAAPAEKIGFTGFGVPRPVGGQEGFIIVAAHPATNRLLLARVRSDKPADDRLRSLLLSEPGKGIEEAAPVAGAATLWEISRPGAATAAFDPTGEAIVVGVDTGTVELAAEHSQIIDARSGIRRRELTTLSGTNADWSADGRWLLTDTGQDGCALTRAEDGRPGPALEIPGKSTPDAHAISPDGRVVAVAYADGISLLDTITGRRVARLPVPVEGVSALVALRFSPDGTQLAALYNNSRLALWDLAAMHRELAKLGLDWAK